MRIKRDGTRPKYRSIVLLLLSLALVAGVSACGDDDPAGPKPQPPESTFEVSVDSLTGPILLDGESAEFQVSIHEATESTRFDVQVYVDDTRVQSFSTATADFALEWEPIRNKLSALSYSGRSTAQLEVRVTNNRGESARASIEVQFEGGIVHPVLHFPLDGATVLLGIEGSSASVTVYADPVVADFDLRFQVASDPEFTDLVVDEAVSSIYYGQGSATFEVSSPGEFYWRSAIRPPQTSETAPEAWTESRRLVVQRFRRNASTSDISSIHGIAADGSGGVLAMVNRVQGEVSLRGYDSNYVLTSSRDMATSDDSYAQHFLVSDRAAGAIAVTNRDIQSTTYSTHVAPVITGLDGAGASLWEWNVPDLRSSATYARDSWVSSIAGDGDGGAALVVTYYSDSQFLAHVRDGGAMGPVVPIAGESALRIDLVDAASREFQLLSKNNSSDLSTARFDSTLSRTWRRDFSVQGSFNTTDTYQAVGQDGSTLIAGTWYGSEMRETVFLAGVGPNGSLLFERQIDVLEEVGEASGLFDYTVRGLFPMPTGGTVLVLDTTGVNGRVSNVRTFVLAHVDFDGAITWARQVIAPGLYPAGVVGTTQDGTLRAGLQFRESSYSSSSGMVVLLQMDAVSSLLGRFRIQP